VTKSRWMVVLLLIGCLVAGVYGALHDQISYTVSPDYYHAFKYQQFHIPEEWHNRVGAAIVGWRATWWMGVIIGVPVLAAAYAMPDVKTYVSRSLIAFCVVAATALLVGLGALVHAYLFIDAEHLPAYWYPNAVNDRVAFARAGTMHNFSYLGGFLGILTAIAYLAIARIRIAARAHDRCSGDAKN
jgi:hypothetical protein